MKHARHPAVYIRVFRLQENRNSSSGRSKSYYSQLIYECIDLDWILLQTLIWVILSGVITGFTLNYKWLKVLLNCFKMFQILIYYRILLLKYLLILMNISLFSNENGPAEVSHATTLHYNTSLHYSVNKVF